MTTKEEQLNGENEEGRAELSMSAGLEALTISGEAPEGLGDNEDVKSAKDSSAGTQGKDNNDEDLFKALPPKVECPLCLVPLPIRRQETIYHTCCGKIICAGCLWKHDQVRDKINAKKALKDPPEPPLERNCAFCRAALTCTPEKRIARIKARMALSDPDAFEFLARFYIRGLAGLTRDTRKAFELRLRAAELGSANACYNVSCLYSKGHGVDRDTSKEEHYLKLAAKKVHILARHNLCNIDYRRGNSATAVKHWVISASAGCDNSLKKIGLAYRKKLATTDQYEMAIRANGDAKKEMQSEDRDKAKAARAAGLLRVL